MDKVDLKKVITSKGWKFLAVALFISAFIFIAPIIGIQITGLIGFAFILLFSLFSLYIFGCFAEFATSFPMSSGGVYKLITDKLAL
jgi:amino acid transporter